MKRIILLFGLIFSLVAVKANAGEAPTNEQKAHNSAIQMQKVLTLSDEQTVKVEAVLLKSLVDAETIQKDASKDAAAKNVAVEAAKQNRDHELQAIMTPDQYSLYQHKMEERKTRRDIAH